MKNGKANTLKQLSRGTLVSKDSIPTVDTSGNSFFVCVKYTFERFDAFELGSPRSRLHLAGGPRWLTHPNPCIILHLNINGETTEKGGGGIGGDAGNSRYKRE